MNSHGCPDRFHVSGHVIALLNYPVDRISWALFYTCLCKEMGFPGSVGVKTLLASAGDTRGTGSIPESGRFPGVGNGNRPQYSCLKNSMDRGAWWAKVHGVTRVGHDLATKSPPPPSYLIVKVRRYYRVKFFPI